SCLSPMSSTSISCSSLFYCYVDPRDLHSFPTRRSSDLCHLAPDDPSGPEPSGRLRCGPLPGRRHISHAILPFQQRHRRARTGDRSEEHTSELQSRENLVCRLLLEKKKNKN